MPITITKVITDEQLRCLSNDLVGFPDDIAVMTVELQRRIDYVIDHKVVLCAKRMVEQQAYILGDTRPTDVGEAAIAIGDHPDFKTRDMRDRDS